MDDFKRDAVFHVTRCISTTVGTLNEQGVFPILFEQGRINNFEAFVLRFSWNPLHHSIAITIDKRNALLDPIGISQVNAKQGRIRNIVHDLELIFIFQ